MADDDLRSSPAGIAFVAITIFGVIALFVLAIFALPVVFVFNWLTIVGGALVIAVAYVFHRRRLRRERAAKR